MSNLEEIDQLSKLLNYINYIEQTYISETHYFTHLNEEHFRAILEDETDCTSSSAESVNAKLNSTFSNGKKSLATIFQLSGIWFSLKKSEMHLPAS